MKTRGVYFLSNDRILDLTLAFLNSFRVNNPTLPLCLIPFKDDVKQLSAMKDKYSFSIYENSHVLQKCDDISLLFHKEVTGHYRKLACWQGPFDEFIYIDVDMLVFKDLSFGFDLLNKFAFITSSAYMPEAVQWVWKPSVYETGILSDDQIQFAANTGFIVSEKSRLPASTLYERAKTASSLACHMELYCKEQPLLNYLMVTSGQPYSSLSALLDNHLFPQNYVEYWAGHRKRNLRRGLKVIHHGVLREIFIIHWAGVWQPKPYEIELYKVLNRFKLKKSMWLTSITMPLKSIWRRYRMKAITN